MTPKLPMARSRVTGPKLAPDLPHRFLESWLGVVHLRQSLLDPGFGDGERVVPKLRARHRDGLHADQLEITRHADQEDDADNERHDQHAALFPFLLLEV